MQYLPDIYYLFGRCVDRGAHAAELHVSESQLRSERVLRKHSGALQKEGAHACVGDEVAWYVFFSSWKGMFRKEQAWRRTGKDRHRVSRVKQIRNKLDLHVHVRGVCEFTVFEHAVVRG
jgi:hypothetical protein